MNKDVVFEYLRQILASYESPEDVDVFYNDIKRRNEFLELMYDDPRIDARFYNHQSLLQRLLSPETGIQNQLIYYHMGLGKSIIYLSLIDLWRPHIENLPLILVRNSKLASVLKREIVHASRAIFKNQDFPDDATPQAISSIIKQKYRIKTYHKFATQLQAIPDDVDYFENIRALGLFNTVIVADEVQHIKNMQNLNIYDMIYKCFKLVNLTTRIYLFTGTPMIDDAAEFESVINLITPDGAPAVRVRFDGQNKLENIEEMKRAIVGNVSYLKGADRGFVLRHAPNTEYLQYYSFDLKRETNSGVYIQPIGMTNFQSYHYYRALRQDGIKSGPLVVSVDLPNIVQTYIMHTEFRALVLISSAFNDLKSIIEQARQDLQEYTKNEVTFDLVVCADTEAIAANLMKNRLCEPYTKCQVKARANLTESDVFQVCIILKNTTAAEQFVLSHKSGDDFYLFDHTNQYAANVSFVRVGRVGRADRTHSMYKYETEMDRFIKSLEEQMDKSENLDDVDEEYMPEALVANKQSAAYSNSAQASLFVYPNGSYGRSGELTYMKSSYNARTLDDWLIASKRYPRDCTIYTQIITEWKSQYNANKWEPTIVYSTGNNSNVLFLMKVLASIGFARYSASSSSRRAPTNSYHIIKYGKASDLAALKREVIGVLNDQNMHVLFLIGKEDIVDVLDAPQNARIVKLGEFERASQQSLFDAYFGRAQPLEIAELVKKHSIKYYTILKHILLTKGKVYIYSELIGGSGLVVLMRLLDLMGYTNMADENEDKIDIRRMPQKPRYAFVSSKVSDVAMERILNVYNDQRNVDGSYIQIFMGTETVSEGISLYDTDVMFDLTPNWNIASLEQAEQRICRLGAFARLKKHRQMRENQPMPVYINRLTALPLRIKDTEPVGDARAIINNWIPNDAAPDKSKSLDYYMYATCMQKDIQIKQVERVCKTAALDCQLNKNRMSGVFDAAHDYTRSCDYSTCEYKCDYVSLDGGEILTDTYNEFYANDIKREVLDAIVSYFKEYTSASYESLMRAIHNLVMDLPLEDAVLEEDIKPILPVIHHTLYNIIQNKTQLMPGLVLCYDNNLFYTINAADDRGECCSIYNMWYAEKQIESAEAGRVIPANMTMHAVRAELNTEYRVEIAELINGALKVQTPEELRVIQNNPKFTLFETENTRELVRRAISTVGAPGAGIVLELYNKYINRIPYNNETWIILRIDEPYSIYNPTISNQVVSMQDLYLNSNDAIKNTMIDMLYSYISTRLDDIHATVAAKFASIKEAKAPAYVYGVYHYKDKFNVYVSNDITDKTKLKKDIKEYLSAKKSEYPVRRGIVFETLDATRKAVLRALMGLSKNQLLAKASTIDYLTKNGLIF